MVQLCLVSLLYTDLFLLANKLTKFAIIRHVNISRQTGKEFCISPVDRIMQEQVHERRLPSGKILVQIGLQISWIHRLLWSVYLNRKPERETAHQAENSIISKPSRILRSMIDVPGFADPILRPDAHVNMIIEIRDIHTTFW